MNNIEKNAKENLKVLRGLINQICEEEFLVYLDIECNPIEVYKRFLPDPFGENLDLELQIFKDNALLSEDLFCSVSLVAQELLDNVYICNMSGKPVTGSLTSIFIAAIYLYESGEEQYKKLAAKIFRTAFDELYEPIDSFDSLPTSALSLTVLSTFTDIPTKVMFEGFESGNVSGFLNIESPQVPYAIRRRVETVKTGYNVTIKNTEHMWEKGITVNTKTLLNNLEIFMASRGVENYGPIAEMLVTIVLEYPYVSKSIKTDIIKSIIDINE